MTDTTIKKIDSQYSPTNRSEKYLASGKSIGLRLWEQLEPGCKEESQRLYETVGFVLRGSAELVSAGQVVILKENDSWLVPAGVKHHYNILETFTAIEATCPPAQLHGRED